MAYVTVKVEITRVPQGALLKPMRRFWTRLQLAAHADAAQPGRVPIDEGHLRSSLAPGAGVSGIDPSDPPMWFAYGSNVSYGMYLEAPEKRDPHYRDGPSKGQPTAGWLSKTLPNIESAIDAALAELAASMEAAHGNAK